MNATIGYSFVAMAVGSLVGLSELLSRYPWPISNVIKFKSGWAYLILNAIVSLLAYQAAVEWKFPASLNDKSEIWRVLVSSFLGMAVLRSSFFNIKVGNENFQTGFATIVNIFMARAERSLDKSIWTRRWFEIEPHLENLAYLASKDYFLAVVVGGVPADSK